MMDETENRAFAKGYRKGFTDGFSDGFDAGFEMAMEKALLILSGVSDLADLEELLESDEGSIEERPETEA